MPTERDLRAVHHALPIGIVLRRSLRMLGIEPFYAGFIAGMEDVLAEQEGSVLSQVVPSMEKELECYERWAASGQIAGVFSGIWSKRISEWIPARSRRSDTRAR